VPLQDILQDRD
jgi:hypothetical protein